MSGVRRLFLDRSPGERRGVVLLDGAPERLLIERDGEPPRAALGEVRRGRVTAVERAQKFAFVDLGLGETGVLKLSGEAAALTQGAAVEIEVRAEAGEPGKGPTLRFVGLGEGRPALLRPAPPLAERLQALAPGVPVQTGDLARDAADVAEAAALETVFDFPGGERLTVEPTRALVAVDVDWSPTAAVGGRKASAANRRALVHAARLLRLKGLAGTVVIDLLGFGDDRELHAAAKAAFAPDGARVLPPSPLGLLQVAIPRAVAPLSLRLLDADGRLSARTVAQRAVRALEREGRADPGSRLVAVCAPDVAEALAPLAAELGPRYSARPDPAFPRQRVELRTA